MFNIIFKMYLLRLSIMNFLDILKFYPKQLVVITNIGYTRWRVYECSAATFRIVIHYPLSSYIVFNWNVSILFAFHDLFFLWDPKNPWGEIVAVDSGLGFRNSTLENCRSSTYKPGVFDFKYIISKAEECPRLALSRSGFIIINKKVLLRNSSPTLWFLQIMPWWTMEL